MIHGAIKFRETLEKNKQAVSRTADQDPESLKGVSVFLITASTFNYVVYEK